MEILTEDVRKREAQGKYIEFAAELAIAEQQLRRLVSERCDGVGLAPACCPCLDAGRPAPRTAKK